MREARARRPAKKSKQMRKAGTHVVPEVDHVIHGFCVASPHPSLDKALEALNIDGVEAVCGALLACKIRDDNRPTTDQTRRSLRGGAKQRN